MRKESIEPNYTNTRLRKSAVADRILTPNFVVTINHIKKDRFVGGEEEARRELRDQVKYLATKKKVLAPGLQFNLYAGIVSVEERVPTSPLVKRGAI